MLKKLFLLLVLLLGFFQPSKAQESGVQIGAFAEFAHSPVRLESSQLYGIKPEFHLTERWSIYYKFGLGSNPAHKVYGHVPFGFHIGTLLFLWGLPIDGYGWSTIFPAIICAMIPEGVTFRVIGDESLNFRLYLSPLASEILYDSQYDWLVSGELGAKVNYIWKEKVQISPYFGARLLYLGGRPYFNGGIQIGYLIPD